MTTMDSYLTSKKKDFYNVIEHYSNLSLDECSNVSPFHTTSITFNCKKDSKIDLINSNESQTKKAKNLWNQKNPSPNYLNMLENFEGKEFKVGNKFSSSKNTTNNSALFLHISANESSVDAATLDSFGDDDEISSKQTMVKNWRNAKQLFTGSPWTIQNPFEFPRQQSDKVSEPEVSQFRASQLLYNPNGTNSTTTTTTNEQNVDSNAPSNQIATEVNESRSHNDTIDTKGDSNNGTKQQQRRQIPQLKRRRVSFGAAVGENATPRQIVRPNYIRLQPQSTFRPIFDPNSPLRFSSPIRPVVNGRPKVRLRHQTSDPIVITLDMSPPLSPSLNDNQIGAEFDDVASVHRSSPVPSVSSMASATVPRNSSSQNVLISQQQPTLGDEAAQQRIPTPAPVGQENNQTPAAEQPTNLVADANVPEPAQLQQQHIQNAPQQPPQEVNNYQMLAAEIERLKRVNEYKEQAALELWKSKMIDKFTEGLNRGI